MTDYASNGQNNGTTRRLVVTWLSIISGVMLIVATYLLNQVSDAADDRQQFAAKISALEATIVEQSKQQTMFSSMVNDRLKEVSQKLDRLSERRWEAPRRWEEQ